ncbi:hypothetical protein [Prauserella endophytica]|uniref:Uncharacterized protein n=1 Tax=Prauserella endophytica TaxID=1592324 RepID=A0ABY2RWL2_9PSEU|nr:hypothetical protein [Prauserella endophytica]TKG61557.1 hypothetical protein FCN18_33505 [Prauserella endophytica]
MSDTAQKIAAEYNLAPDVAERIVADVTEHIDGLGSRTEAEADIALEYAHQVPDCTDFAALVGRIERLYQA